VEVLLDSGRDTLAYQLAVSATGEESQKNIGFLLLNDQSAFPGISEIGPLGRADSSRKKRRLSDDKGKRVEEPLEAAQREVTG
jgi:hypothetical protein